MSNSNQPGHSESADDSQLSLGIPTGVLLAPKVAALSKALLRVTVHHAKAHFGLSQVECQVVSQLGMVQPASIRELACIALMDAAQISRAVSALSRRGLVERGRSSRDSREAALRLTITGMEIARELRNVAELRNARVLQGLDPATLAELFELLDILIARAMKDEIGHQAVPYGTAERTGEDRASTDE